MHILIAALHRPSKPTGVCRHAANLAQCLADTKEVTKVTLIVGAWQKHYFKTFFNSKKINLIEIDIENSALARNMWFLFGLPKLANRLLPDLVYMSFPFPFVRTLFSSPVISTIHDLYPYEKPEVFGYPNAIFNRLFLKQCITNSDGLVCVSKSTANSLKLYFPNLHLRKLVTVIYNYVSLEGLKSNSSIHLPISDRDSFLLSIAQHRSNKNINLAIQAFWLLIKNKYLKNTTKLVIVGNNGPETEKIQQLINRLSLQELVLLLDSIEDNELCWLYQNCEMFIAPSSQEGFCLPLAEAMHFSCKIVCSDIPIFREIGSSNCTYFDLQGDPVKNLSQAMINALEKPLSQTAKDLRFSKSDVAARYLKFYAAIARKSPLRVGILQRVQTSFDKISTDNQNQSTSKVKKFNQ
ncbi:glycosyltransferase family 1 protein [Chroococcidiopsis sp. CCNUC1]|uniref:glycosyltransferase family 4 protein n=1 Tax=Chroococcidiopsis sp. CCNUC1 TaxID=2653189 RepID=UPI002020E62A|nr:glycosyltransferase family 1 protein [Chroococcidiopsis sp. CCNUC1]URD51196.1 glycosyltransferase family 4 protein [Chroococcidiopsis sp. CCNUC1]